MNNAENSEYLGAFDELYLSLDISNSRQAAKGGKKVLQLGESVNKPLCPNLSSESKYYVDHIPFLCLANGLMVNDLLLTDAYTHVDFIPIDRIEFIYDGGTSYSVPFSKDDIFSTNQFTLLEKRKLMRGINNCPVDQGGSTFYQYLSQGVGLDDKLCRMILFSICFANDLNISINEGINRCKLFTSSINKFGQKTPLLYPIYGSNEISQAFCRICAVNGGTQVPTAREILIDADLVYFVFEGTKYRAKFTSNCTTCCNAPHILYRAHVVERFDAKESLLIVHNINQMPVYELALSDCSRCVPPGHLIRYFWSSSEDSISGLLSAKGYPDLEICRSVCDRDIFS